MDECQLNVCHAQASCTNTLGSYKCVCIDGFQGNGSFCQGIVRETDLFLKVVKIMTPEIKVVSKEIRYGSWSKSIVDHLKILVLAACSSNSSSSSSSSSSGSSK